MNVAYAVIKDDIVRNMIDFASDEDAETFDCLMAFGEGYYLVKIQPEDFVSDGYYYKDGKFIAPPPPEPTKEQLIQQANQEKAQRLSSADNIFLEWQTKLLLNIASDDEKNAVIAWVNYKDAVRAIDTSEAPNITWPEQPPIPENAQ